MIFNLLRKVKVLKFNHIQKMIFKKEHEMKNNTLKYGFLAFAIATSLTLAACGGGGSDESTDTTTPTNPTTPTDPSNPSTPTNPKEPTVSCKKHDGLSIHDWIAPVGTVSCDGVGVSQGDGFCRYPATSIPAYTQACPMIR